MEPISERLSKILALVNREPQPLSKLGRPGLYRAQGGRVGSQEWVSVVPLSPNAIVKNCTVVDIGKSLNHDLTGVTARYMKHTCSTLLKRKTRDTGNGQVDEKATAALNSAFSLAPQRNKSNAWARNVHGKSYETPALRARMAERVGKAVAIGNETEESFGHTMGSILRSTSCNESSILEEKMAPDSLRRTASQIVLESVRSTVELAWEEGSVSVTCSIPVTNEITAAEVLRSLTDSETPSVAKQGSAQVVIDFSCTGDGTDPVHLKLPRPSAEKEAPGGFSTDEIEVEEIKIVVDKSASPSNTEENLAASELCGLVKLVLTYPGDEGTVKVDLASAHSALQSVEDGAVTTNEIPSSDCTLNHDPEVVELPQTQDEVVEIKDARFHEVRPPLRHIQTGRPQPEITAHESGTAMERRNIQLPQAKHTKSRKILSKLFCRGKMPLQ